mmetsp:Transcript_30619/g.49067  ORF Transcript_30619/g.49067 Transcript_30619/m.49067 type:complete len:272 (-) Transcript_30619:198-1013(-)
MSGKMQETSSGGGKGNGETPKFADGGPGLLGTLLPFIYFPCDSSESRHAYMENLFNTVWGKMLTFLPFILIMAIACHHALAATWSAFLVELLVILVSIYRSRYNKFVPAIMFLNGGLCLGFLGQAIAVSVLWGDKRQTYNCSLISPVNTSILFGVTLLSMILCVPFTMQFARAHVPEEVAKSSSFLMGNQIMTGFWLVLFAIMSAATWCAYAFYRNNRRSVEYIILATVLPIVLVLVGGILTPKLADVVRKQAKAKRAAKSGMNNEEDNPI